MSNTTHQLAGRQKIETDFNYLIATFKEMLHSLGEEALAAALPFGKILPQ